MPFVRAGDEHLEASILEMLAQRAIGTTICPSEVARAIGGATWRDLMDDTRRAALRLRDSGAVDITQGGTVVDPDRVRGPIRIRLREGSEN